MIGQFLTTFTTFIVNRRITIEPFAQPT